LAEPDHQQLIIRRLIESERSINFEIEKILGTRLRTYKEDEVKQLLRTALEHVREFVKSYRLVTERGEAIVLEAEVFSEVIRTKLDHLFYLIDVITNQEVSLSIYDFLDFFIKKIELSNLSFIIIKSEILSCYCLNDYLKEFFRISSGKELIRVWIINCPIRVEINPFEWPIILHELGHIAEVESLKTLVNMEIIDKYHLLPDPETVEGVRVYHALEYISDLIAYSLIGPVFLFRLTESYLTKTLTIPITHPEWISRLHFLLQIATELHKQAISPEGDHLFGLMEKEWEREKDGVLIKPPPYLGKVKEYIRQRVELVQIDKEKFKKCLDRVKQFYPYTEDIPILMNASYIVSRNTLFDLNIRKHFDNDESKLSSEFSYLIADCIRLTRLRYLTLNLLRRPA
jgi:hypothetical protein